jgi:hypothetical protein
VLHPSQLGPLLDLRLSAGHDAARLAWDLLAVLDDWIALAGGLDFGVARLPTPARQRSTCDLVANVFPPVALLPDAWASGRFAWPADHEEQNRIDAETSREDPY